MKFVRFIALSGWMIFSVLSFVYALNMDTLAVLFAGLAALMVTLWVTSYMKF